MALTFRKSISAGPFRFNLSGSGIGVSVGIPGFRIGTGPRGNYASLSAGSFRYHHSLNGKRHSRSTSRSLNQKQPAPEKNQFPAHLTHISSGSDTVAPMELIRSADIEKLSDSSADELLTEINKKKKMLPLWPWPLLAIATLTTIQLNKGVEPLTQHILIGSLVLVAIATIWLYLWDDARRTVVLFYYLDAPAQNTYERVLAAFLQLQGCRKSWHIEAQGQVLSRKHHAGASVSIKRTSANLSIGNLKPIRCNIDVPSLKAGPIHFYFYPDKVLIEKSDRIAACSYESLEARSSSMQFIEDESVPADSQVVGHTWSFVNKNGGPDRRFNNNRQLPIAEYGELSLTTPQGVRELYQFSRPSAPHEFETAMQRLAQFNAKALRHSAQDTMRETRTP